MRYAYIGVEILEYIWVRYACDIRAFSSQSTWWSKLNMQ
jgi:hypothetical protein